MKTFQPIPIVSAFETVQLAGSTGIGNQSTNLHGVQRRTVLVDNFFEFSELNFFAYLLLHVT